MLKVKIIESVAGRNLVDDLNDFLATLKSEDVRKTVYDQFPQFIVVEYEKREAWAGKMCAECQYWDDSGSSDAVVGLCQECGGRKRFNCKACSRFKDIRG